MRDGRWGRHIHLCNNKCGTDRGIECIAEQGMTGKALFKSEPLSFAVAERLTYIGGMLKC